MVWAPASDAASAMYAPRTMLFSGSCIANAEPPPPIRLRNIHDFGFTARKRSRSIRA